MLYLNNYTTNYPNGTSTTLSANKNGEGAPFTGLNTGLIGDFTSVTTLTAAEVNALNTTPVQILAAPEVSTQLILLRAFALVLNYQGTAYANGSGSDLRFKYGTTGFFVLNNGAGLDGIIEATSSCVNYFTVDALNNSFLNYDPITLSQAIGKAINVDLSAALTTAGDSPLTIISYFSVFDTPFDVY